MQPPKLFSKIPEPKDPPESLRLKITVHGAVQGVGFRPFVYRLATELRLDGWVLNSSQGVFIEVEGPLDLLRVFLARLAKEMPALAIIQSLESSFLDIAGYQGFEIRYSDHTGPKTALILPDIAICADCLRELFDPSNRRYRYPFTNCTNCGPRFSIIEELPYDRPNTSMRRFRQCPECEVEYHDPLNRRFHAQPNACPKCGPHIELWDGSKTVLATENEALLYAADLISLGKIVALKGIGGFQLICAAHEEEFVRRLRQRKRREGKPFALMYPALDRVKRDCLVSSQEERLLVSPESPIVLLMRCAGESSIAPSVAPRNRTLGVMLPYTPLHHLLMRELNIPVVATSGNLANEPICIDEAEAVDRLEGIADFFLVHDRPIVRHVDDSIARVVCHREMVLRRARGYAPLPVRMKEPLPAVLAVGAHLKNTVALSVGRDVFISQHIGDLETTMALTAFQRTVADLPKLYDTHPELVACDLHPDYISTKYATGAHPTVERVQHHWAHVLACMAENELEAPVLGVAWDGTGYGTDGTIWGGEFLVPVQNSFQRVAHFRHFRLPGGEMAVKEPRRTALAVLYEIWGQTGLEDGSLVPVAEFSKTELGLIRQMLAKGVNAPVTSSVGRLFDAVAALVGIRQQVTFEGQAAMELESLIESDVTEVYPFELSNRVPQIIDWAPLIGEILVDVRSEISLGVIAAKFHNTLAEIIVEVARQIVTPKIVLTGGCFQNRYLLEQAVQRLSQAGFKPYWHQRVPPNDGGIALGQIAAAALVSRRTVATEGVQIR
ncbi:MAG: carbamoyltransferase HypF [Verrucomicrobia bacterium]|nr:carbamoyltransferase HypF [Verrucomicrobiota bacterium]